MADRHYLICGGCGFIGSNFVYHLHDSNPDVRITIFDLLTYAGSLDNIGELQEDELVDFVLGDIASIDDLKELVDNRYTLLINFAAETHVDRSLYSSEQFVRSNVLGVSNLLTLCRDLDLPLLHISTDEVYGPAADGVSFDETAPVNPTSPYAASKAAADLMVTAAVRTFKQPVTVVRTCNNYGPRQYPEKLIPFFIHLGLDNKPLPLYGEGRQRRCWLHVADFCDALGRVVSDFRAAEIFNLGSRFEIENRQVARALVDLLASSSKIKSVAERPAHDPAYRLDSGKFESIYGSIPCRDFSEGLKETVVWYRSHSDFFKRLESRETRDFLKTHYDNRT
jgi:dTDP-glucose 4,6-dehydratase